MNEYLPVTGTNMLYEGVSKSFRHGRLEL